MARNRKNQSAAIRFGPAIWALLLCLLIGGSGVGYVWLQTQIYQLGLQKGKREQQLAALRNQNEKLRGYLAELCSPPRLDARVRELNLGLGPPQPAQVWRLVESNSDGPLLAPSGQLAARQPGPARSTEVLR